MTTDDQPLSTKRRWVLFVVIIAGLVALDQWSKWYAVAHWQGIPRQSFLGDTFRIEYAENHGAFLSFLAGASPEVRFWTLTVMNGLVLVGLAIYLLWSKDVAFWSFFALTLVVGGGIGNLIDRARFHYVIDYFNIGIGSLRSGIFNVADMAITAGFLIMGWLILLDSRQEKATTSVARPTDSDQASQPA
ncbi:MAG: signal peptidase II [Planctomycetaceae bacterium]|nr:signal peptidase II [Planctomycetaceae bacterium]